jgi:hypothetical protein
MRSVLGVSFILVASLAGACSSSSATTLDDGGTDARTGADAHPDATRDGGAPSDAHRDATKDASRDAPMTDAPMTDAPRADAADAASGLTCGELVKCDQACGSSNTCTEGCFLQTTENGQALFNRFNACLEIACPSSGGGPCVSPSSSDCSTCNQTAATGPCVGELAPCLTDTMTGPPNGDAGTGTADAGTGELNCGGIVACVSNCPIGSSYDNCASVGNSDGTAHALALYGTLNDCLNTACPTTDGGVCTSPGTACAGCQEQAVFAMPNICAVPWTSCQQDTSASGDAGASTPTALQDGGVVSTVATGIVQPASTIVVSNDYLYFAQVETGPVLRLTLPDGGAVNVADAGGAVVPLGPSTQTACGLALDSKNLYVWSYGTFSGTTSFNNNDGTVTQVPLDGSPAITLDHGMETFYDAPYLTSVAVDSQNVYWVKGAMGDDGIIMRTAIGSTAATPIFTMQQIPEAIATDGTNVYWADWGTFDAQGASNNDAKVWQGSVSGGTPLLLASNQQAPAAIVVDSHNVYWTNLGKLGASLFPATNSGSVVQVPIGGGPLVTVATSQAIPVGLAVSGGMVYWTVYGLSAPGQVMSAPSGGGTSIPLVGGLNDPFSLTLSGNTLYWTNTPSSNGSGTILSYTPL